MIKKKWADAKYRKGRRPHMVAAEGVFLEIGLTPNSLPVQGLVPLNGAGEIAVNRD